MKKGGMGNDVNKGGITTAIIAIIIRLKAIKSPREGNSIL